MTNDHYDGLRTTDYGPLTLSSLRPPLIACYLHSRRRCRGPGGSRGLQTRCGSSRGGLGGFDSHTPPPNKSTTQTDRKDFLKHSARFAFIPLAVIAQLC